MQATRLLPCAVAALLVASVASAVPVPVYDSIDNPLPGSYPSVGYEATSTLELGDHVVLAPGGRNLQTVTVVLTDWACENDYDYDEGTDTWSSNRAGNAACVTTPGSGFTHPITVNIYAVDNSGADPAVGALVATRTQDVFVPFRPSHDADNCPDPSMDVPFGGTWFDPVLGFCVHGYNVPVDFDFTGTVLPDEVIVSVAYNTAHHGYAPIGSNGPYNSLNYGLSTADPSVGMDAEVGTVFYGTTFGGFYCDGGSGGVGVFRRDADCWDAYIPAMRLAVAPATYAIDVRPNNVQNQINTGARQLVPIAILGSDGFDPVADVDPDSVHVRGAEPSSTRTDEVDVNGDGYRDLTLYFRARDLEPPSEQECADPDAMLLLTGNLMTGEPFEGSDHVTWLGC